MKIKYIPVLIALFLLSFSCTSDFDEINTDPKNLTTGNLGLSTYPLVVKNAIYSTVFMGSEARGAFQLGHSLFADVYANYFATTHPNFVSDRYIFDGRWLNGAYSWFYNSAAPQIKYIEDFAEENGYEVEAAIAKVWRVFSYHRITDYWGPIPYKNYGNGELSVPYDSQEDIYSDFFVTLDEAVGSLKSHSGETASLGNNDVVFGGNVDLWLSFANSLRLRLAMRIKYADPAKAKSEAEKAVQDGIIEENNQNAFVTSTNDWRNGYTTITQWGEFRMSADMESILKGYKDPRIANYFAEAADPDPSDDPAGLTFNYEGMRNGQTKSDRQGISFNTKASDMAAPYTEAGGIGPNWPLIRAAEVWFLRAEGALEGWNMGSSVQESYEAGIAASMEENGLDGSDLSGGDYLSGTNGAASYDGTTAAVSTVPVAFDAGADTEGQLEQIITQKWIGLYPDSWEAWAERRRTGYPTLYPRLGSDNPNVGVNDLPRRVPYVSTEYDTNEEALQNAISTMLGGPDNGVTKLWWDKK